MTEMTDNNFRSGFIAVAGRTNVGKSTLLNALVGQKISIVSDKPQTTRNVIRLIRTTETSQMVFVDAPGFHRPKSKLGEYMSDAAKRVIGDVDVVLFVVEEDIAVGPGDTMIADTLRECGKPVILVINKIDKIPKEQILKKMALYKDMTFISEIVPVSAQKQDNIDTLAAVIEKYLPEGPMYFAEDMLTDRAVRFVAAEIIREKLLRCLNDEIPHGTAVEINSMKERDNSDITDISADIICENKRHKAIIIGKDGAMMKKVASAARYELEQLLEGRVNLEVWVKVREDWRDKPALLKELGYEEESDM